ncbi:glucokinase glkA [Hypoxylon sp. NC1633]|nr:glucokinase glkA [Hypoxylon sp. NC1633]
MSTSPNDDTPRIRRANAIASQFCYTDDDIRRCSTEFLRELRLGLQQKRPSMCQIPTYLTRAATGHEKGLAIGVDLGGTNLRVCSVELHGDSTSTVLQSQARVPPELMVAKTSRELFSYIAKQIRDFLLDCHPSSIKAAQDDSSHSFFALGFAFSFPVYQSGFDIPDAVGQDVCKSLQGEIDLLCLPVKITALVNDAAGTIMSRAYALPPAHTRPSIGAIFGTGTNGVYLQNLSEITKPLDGDYDKTTGSMFINTEWGSFDNHLSVLPITPYDVELNEHSVNPQNQMFEKRVSGMFLGELLRLAILDLDSDESAKWFRASGVGCGFDSSTPLHRRWAVDSSILSVAELDNSESLLTLRNKIHLSLGIRKEYISEEDARAVKIIARAIGTRAARLAGMAIGSVIIQSQGFDQTSNGEVVEETTVDVAVDGSVVEHYPGFEQHMRGSLRALEKIGGERECRINIGHAKDGSGVGAGVIALLAAQQKATVLS